MRFNGYYSTKKLHDIGIIDSEIVQQCQKGNLLKIKQGLYRGAKTFINNQNFIDITHAIPNCIIVGISALNYYNLTTAIPNYTEIAIPKNYKKPKIFAFNTQMHNCDIKKFKKNIIKVKQGRYSFNIFDKEQTICYALKYRHIIGVDVIQEVLKNYVKTKDINTDKLFRLARKNHQQTIINKLMVNIL